MLAQHGGRQIFHRAGLAVRRVVEDGIELALREVQGRDGARRDGRVIGEFQRQRLDAFDHAQPLQIIRRARCCQHAPSARLHGADGIEANAG